MAIDFRSYKDPGVYIEAINPPVVFNPAIEPTILAIVGNAPGSRMVNESVILTQTPSSTPLVSLGGDPATLTVSDPLLGTVFVSGARGRLDAAILASATTFSVTPFSNVTLQPVPFDIWIFDERMTVTNITPSPVAGGAPVTAVWTVTRAVGGTVATNHISGQIVNTAESYVQIDSVLTGTLDAPITASATSFIVNTTAIADPGVTVGQYLEIDGERMMVATGTTAAVAHVQTVRVVRGITGTVAASHGAVSVYTNTGADYTVRVNSAGIISIGILDSTRAVVVEQQTITLSNTGGAYTFKLTFGGVENATVFTKGAPITFTALQTALRTMTGLGGLTVSGANDTGPWLVTFVGGTINYGMISVTSITGAMTAAVTETVQGYPTNGFFGRLAAGTAFVQLNSTDSSQFLPSLFDDMSSVKDKFGAPLTDAGAINSELSLAAQLAFANGATQIILAAANPADGTSGIRNAIDKLASEQTVNVIVALSGDTTDLNWLQTHVNAQSTSGNLRRAFVGLTGTSISSTTFTTRAQQFHDERMTLVAPGSPQIDMGASAPLSLPGYFLAVAAAGVHAGLQPQEPLTRKQIWGFVGIADQKPSSEIFQMQSKGVLVVFEDRFGRLIIKHGLTTNMATDYTREISVVAARDRLRDLVLETLESGELIGSAITVSTPNLVSAGVTAALDTAVAADLIFDFGNVTFRQPSDTPTLIEVQFTYKPTLPLNYVHVQFAIDTTIGTVDFQSINEQPPAA